MRGTELPDTSNWTVCKNLKECEFRVFKSKEERKLGLLTAWELLRLTAILRASSSGEFQSAVRAIV